MVTFKSTILKFDQQGEKTGWSYINVPAAIAEKLKPGNKKSFRVKGMLDNYEYKQVSLLPMGGGDFIMAVNGKMRKAIGKTTGASVAIKMQVDEESLQPPADFLVCLAEEPAAFDAYNRLSNSHQHYFINWLAAAKTEGTKTKRIAAAINALSQGLHFGEMLRKLKNDRIDLSGAGRR